MNPLSPIGLRLLLLFPIVFIGALSTGYAHTRRGILFGVTVPVDFPSTPVARASIRRYRLRVLLLTLVLVSLAAVLLWTIPFNGILPSLITVVGIFTEIITTYLLWHSEAALIKPYAATVPLERVADLTIPSTLPSVLASAAALVPLAAAALWLKLHLAQLPARWPQHWNVSGLPDAWGTSADVFHPLLAGALAVLFMTAFTLFLGRASGPQAEQRRRALVPLAALSWLVAGTFVAASLAPLVHQATRYFVLFTAIYIVAILAITTWLILRSNLSLSASSSLPYDSTPDSHWHAGLFYYNPADASVFVPKRFGLGWTLNFAHPSAWVSLAAILLLLLSAAVLNK